MAFKQKSAKDNSNITADSIAPKTNFATESEAGAAPVNSLLALFGDTEPDPELQGIIGGLERRNLPPMIKPGDIPVGGAIQGTIVKFVESPSEEIKGRLIWLNYKGIDFCVPCTGSIRNAFAPGKKDDDASLDAILAKEVGKFMWARRLPDKPSKFKKSMFVFDVRAGNINTPAKK